MKKIFVFVPFLFVLGIGSWFLLSVEFNTEYEHDGMVEHRKKEQWMLAMLADPRTGEIPLGIRAKEMSFLRFLTSENQHLSKTRAKWRFRGPHNVGGRTRGAAVDVLDENHILAGSVSGGIWETKDGGDTWAKVSAPNDHPGIVSIVQDTREGYTNVWYALSGEISGTSASGESSFYIGDGAFISTNNGTSWKPLSSTATGLPNSWTLKLQAGWRLACSPNTDTLGSNLYMATYGTIYRSTDSGKSWVVVLGANSNSYYSDVAISKTGVVYATLSFEGDTSNSGFYRSENGIQFTKINPPFLKNFERTVLDINPNDENEVYFLSVLSKDSSGGVKTADFQGNVEYVSLLKYTYISGSGSGTGGEWTNLSENLPVTDPDQFDKFNAQGGYDLLVKVQPNTNNVIIGGTNLYISTDGFKTPNNISQFGGYAIGTQLDGFGVYPNHHPDQHDIIFSRSNPNKVISASDGGIKITNNVLAKPVIWQEKSIGYNTSQVYTVTIDEKNAYDQWLLAGFQDNGNYLTRSNDVKSNWNMTINGDGSYNYIAPDKEFCVISTQQGNTRKVILDANGNVLKRKRIDPAGYEKENYNFINCIRVDPNDDNFLYMPVGKKVAIMNNLRKLQVVQDGNKLDYGWNFSDTITTPIINAGRAAEVTTIAVSKNPAHVVYVGTSNKEIYKIDNPTSSNPRLVKLATPANVTTGAYVNQICIDPDDANKLFMVYANYNVISIYYSSNGGKSWFRAGGNLEGSNNSTGANPSIRTVAILKKNDGTKTYFAGTSIGLFSTQVLGIDTVMSRDTTIWIQESADLIGANVIVDIKTRDVDGFVVVGTHGNGVFESYYFGNSIPPSNNIVVSADVYPNPATNVVNFSFNSIKDDIATIYIVDMFGRKVKSIFNEKLNSGAKTYALDISELASGTYHVVFKTSSIKDALVQRFVKIK